MLRALLVSRDSADLSELAAVFSAHGADITRAETGLQAISKAADRFDIVVAGEQLPDMTAMELAEKIIVTNPMGNVAIASSLLPADFHCATEGLGILMQLSPVPDKIEAGNLLERLTRILNMTGKSA